MATLPGNKATVWVGPPLLARVPSPGLLTPTRLLLTPLVNPPLPPVPIKLKELELTTVPPMSLAVVLSPPPRKLPAMMVLRSVVDPETMKSPPPNCPLEPTLTRLAVRVQLMTWMVPEEFKPPPRETAVLPKMVVLIILEAVL